MPNYLIQLGRNTDLSAAEITAVNQRMGSPLRIQERRGEAVFAEAEDDGVVRTLCEQLGGSIRFAECLSHLANDALTPDTIAAELIQTPLFQSDEPLEKVVLGFSLIGDASHWGGKRKVYGLLHDAAGALKRILSERDLSSRFVLPDPQGDNLTLSGAQVDRNHLFKRGGEWFFHADPERGVTIAQTKWLQDYEAFSNRDYGRPQRDAKSGMLPPKLARMMLNLARTPETETVLDPFCGSGGVLMEAALMGLHAVGVDKSPKAVNDAAANGEWLQGRFGLGEPPHVVEGDAHQLRALFEPLFFDACVSEPDLGPPLRKPLAEDKFSEVISQLGKFYTRALAEIRTVARPGARVVFILPRFAVQGRNEHIKINILGDIRLMGYTILDPGNGFQPATGRASLLYARPKQFVQREIFVLQA